MRETDKYYACYEKLVRASPNADIRDTPEYKTLSGRFPEISEIVLLKKALREANFKSRSSGNRLTRLLAGREERKLKQRLGQKTTLIRLRGESRILNDYSTRLLIVSIRTWFSSRISGVRKRVESIRSKLQERSRRARYARAYSLPPSLLDIRSLDPVDRSMALKDWIERRRTRV